MQRFTALVLVPTLCLGASASAQVSLLSTTSNGTNVGGDCTAPTISDDGRLVAFEGTVNTVSSGVFVKDRATGVLAHVSLTSTGTAGTGSRSMISAGGSAVAFTSNHPGMVPGDTNAVADVFVRDMAAGTTTRVSVSSSGTQANAGSDLASISGDGRYVAFQSAATNLAAGDTNGATDVFVHDRLNGTTQLVSVSASGGPSAGSAGYPRISANGRVVAYSSAANDIVLPDNFPSSSELYARDLVSGVTTRVSLSSTGAQAAGSFFSSSEYPWCGGLSPDGRFIAFIGDTGLDAAHPADGWLYLRDQLAGTTRLVSVPPTGQTTTFGDTEGGTMSADGRFVVYGTHQRMTSDDVNPDCDVYVRDMLLGATRRVSPESTGINNTFQPSGNGVMTSDGATVVFESQSPHLLPSDNDPYIDVYAFDWSGVAASAYCTAGSSSNGCVATIASSGTPSGSSGSGFTLTINAADGQRSGLLVYGISGRQALPWGASSTTCVAPPRQRMGLSSTAGTIGACNGSFSVDWNAYVVAHPSALGAPVFAMTPVQAQAYVRDPLSAGHSVLSDAIEFYAVP